MSSADHKQGCWERSQKILIVLAHPDDPEFLCGGTINKWTQAGHTVEYCILTCGDKGTNDRNITSRDLCLLRQEEQREAAAVLGVDQVYFLGYEDGYLVASLALRKDITRIIRVVRPDLLVTCDPTTLYIGDTRLNHPDHRAAGQAALDAVFPAARDHLYFIELWRDENLEPHIVREIWISGTLEPNIVIDVTENWDTKVQSLLKHKSQIGDPQLFWERMINRRTADSTAESPRYEEKFKRLVIG